MCICRFGCEDGWGELKGLDVCFAEETEELFDKELPSHVVLSLFCTWFDVLTIQSPSTHEVKQEKKFVVVWIDPLLLSCFRTM